MRKIDERSFKNKHTVYYVDGVLVKDIEIAQKGIDERKLVTKFDKRSGDVRYLDYNENKWLRKTEKERWTK